MNITLSFAVLLTLKVLPELVVLPAIDISNSGSGNSGVERLLLDNNELESSDKRARFPLASEERPRIGMTGCPSDKRFLS